MAKHLLDETAEFAMPRAGRHAQPEDVLEPTRRFDTGLGTRQPRPEPRPAARPR
ncbi:hypothetical protein [Blastococcus sp. SYSU D00695]